jgi:hypothetical protein
MMSEFDAITQPKIPASPGELQQNGGQGEIVDNADLKAKANTDTINSRQ